MWHTAFWVFLALSLILAAISMVIHKPRFIDLQIVIMVIALVMSCDMLFCKQYGLYHYVNKEYKGWYSLWANFLIIPALGLIFIKFVPCSLKAVSLYILSWAVTFTLFELFITEQVGILYYTGWKVFPYSSVGYVIAFTLEYAYYRLLLKHCR
jgi:hypothetical protein